MRTNCPYLRNKSAFYYRVKDNLSASNRESPGFSHPLRTYCPHRPASAVSHMRLERHPAAIGQFVGMDAPIAAAHTAHEMLRLHPFQHAAGGFRIDVQPSRRIPGAKSSAMRQRAADHFPL